MTLEEAQAMILDLQDSLQQKSMEIQSLTQQAQEQQLKFDELEVSNAKLKEINMQYFTRIMQQHEPQQEIQQPAQEEQKVITFDDLNRNWN